MTDFYNLTLLTSFGQTAVHNELTEQMPEITWRRGESEAQGALTISGRSEDGTHIQFWFYDDDAANVRIGVSLRGTTDPDAGQQVYSRLVNEVLPSFGEVTPRDPLTAMDDVPLEKNAAPAKRRGVASPSREGEVLEDATIVYDLMDWIDPAGEDEIEFVTDGDQLVLRIGFVPREKGAMEYLHLVFEDAVFHQEAPLYGVHEIGPSSPTEIGIANLAELSNSKFLSEWRSDRGTSDTSDDGEMKHYWAMFYEMETVINVLAKSVVVRSGNGLGPQ